MNAATYTGFLDELRGIKLAAFIGPAADLAGLGVLAVPGLKTLRNKDSTATEKNHAKWESAGLGLLGGSVVANDRHEIAEGAGHFMKAKGLRNKLHSAVDIAKGGHGNPGSLLRRASKFIK